MAGLLVCAPCSEARRKKGDRGEKGEQEDKAARADRSERKDKDKDKRRKSKKVEGEPVLEAAAPCPDQEARCESRLAFLLFEEAARPRPLARFTYHFRFGDRLLEGTCPGEGPLARCIEGGVALPVTPEQLDVAIEAEGFRPLLQAVTPTYQLSRSGCATPCRQAELRLVLRRETEEE
jgi:hypothetical protein